MKYNIGFTLGDPSADGHGHSVDYHMVSNYSALEIDRAYTNTTKILGFNLVKDVGDEFEGDYWVPEDFTAKLLELGIIEESDIENEETEYGPPVGTYRLDLDSFVDLYFRIAQYSLPDLEWDEKTLLVFDEVDKGFDLSRQVGMSNMYRNLHKKFNVSILAVTHTLFPILAREEMFYFEFRKMVSSKFYCWMKTGYNITAEKLEENERKED